MIVEDESSTFTRRVASNRTRCRHRLELVARLSRGGTDGRRDCAKVGPSRYNNRR